MLSVPRFQELDTYIVHAPCDVLVVFSNVPHKTSASDQLVPECLFGFSVKLHAVRTGDQVMT